MIFFEPFVLVAGWTIFLKYFVADENEIGVIGAGVETLVVELTASWKSLTLCESQASGRGGIERP